MRPTLAPFVRVHVARGLALGIFLVACVLSAPRAGHAQRVPSPYRFVEERHEAGLFAGYLSATTGRFGYGPAGGIWFGARYGLELTGPLSLEGLAGAVHGTRDIVSPSRPEGDRVVGQGDVLITTIDARLKLTATGARSWHRLAPFAVFGAGVAFDVAPDPTADLLLDSDERYEFGTSFFGTAGVGTRWFLTRRVALRTDAVFSLWQLDTPPGFGDPQLGLGPVQEAEWVRGLSVTASLLFRW